MSDKDTMRIWDKVCKTNPAHTKKITFGRAITAIDPYRQVENATREFGPAGIGWGWEVKRVEYTTTNEIAILIRLWHGEDDKYNGIEQWGQSALYIDNAEKKKDGDCFKKATTDGITKCLSYIGFNADVFLGKYDDNKYVQRLKEEFKEKPPEKVRKLKFIDSINALMGDDAPKEKPSWELLITTLCTRLKVTCTKVSDIGEDIILWDQLAQEALVFWTEKKDKDVT